jgi:hypothetical protein
VVYHFALLDASGLPQNKDLNKGLLGPNTLGIEVTRPDFAAQCGLGNIDPQHVEDGTSSAIEAALEWPLPPEGAVLVTNRPDKDSLGAMAVLLARAEGKQKKIDKCLVNWIGALDRMPFRDARVMYPGLVAMFSAEITDAMNTVVRASHGRYQDIPGKVAAFAKMLTSEMPADEVAKLAEEFARRREQSQRQFTPAEIRGSVAFFYEPGNYDGARAHGNKFYPVIVVNDPQRHTDGGGVQDRWCIVRQTRPFLVFDKKQFEKEINEAEAKARGLTLEQLRAQNFSWGGPANMLVSPQGASFGTKLTKDQILDLARKHLESGIVS